jgi:hypothetical protein
MRGLIVIVRNRFKAAQNIHVKIWNKSRSRIKLSAMR